MAFLADPCPCGWSYDELEENLVKFCHRCGRRSTNKGGFWSTSRPTQIVERFGVDYDGPSARAEYRRQLAEYEEKGLKLNPQDRENDRRGALAAARQRRKD